MQLRIHTRFGSKSTEAWRAAAAATATALLAVGHVLPASWKLLREPQSLAMQLRIPTRFGSKSTEAWRAAAAATATALRAVVRVLLAIWKLLRKHLSSPL